MVSCGSYRVIEDWEVPSGYHGWVLVERANRNALSAMLTFTSVVLKVDSSGRGCTSTALPKGPRLLRFRGVDAEGARHALLLGCPGVGRQVGDTPLVRGQINSYQFGKQLNSSLELKRSSGVARRHAVAGT